MAFNTAQIVSIQQGTDIAPVPNGFETITGPITTLSATRSRLAHFSEDVYDLSAESHIVKLLKVLLGSAGVGGQQRALLLCRMQQQLASTHFFDLDAFYGAVLGARRTFRETLSCDPTRESCPLEMWDEVQFRDGEYRSRVARFAAALQRGCTIEGLRGVAEAMIGERCDISEGWMLSDIAYRTWANTDTLTWAQTDAMRWTEMEFEPTGIPVPRHLVTIRPSVPLSLGEIYDLERALDRIKPAHSLVDVIPSIGSHAISLDAKAYADSSRWDVRQEIRNVRFNGLLLSPGDPEGAFIPTQVPAWARYQGEAWSLIAASPKTVAWSTAAYPVTNMMVDPTAKQTPAQQVTFGTGAKIKAVSFVSEYALLDVQKIMSGRAASEQIVSELPYVRVGQDMPTSSQMMVSQTTPAVRDSTLTNMALLSVDGVAMAGAATTPPSMVRQATFWCSPQRLPSDTTVDALEIRFDKDVTANKFTMKVSNFPATVTVEYWNATTGRWGRVGRTTIVKSVPYLITGQMYPGDLHPLHRGTGHWVPLSFDTPNITTSLYRILFDRIEGYGPVGVGNKQTPYSVAVRDLDIGFRLASIRSVSSAFPLEPVATTINTWGVDIVHKLNVLSPTNALDGMTDTAWVCDAQESNDAIVNFYLDVSTANAQPSVVDELYMVPTHTGPVFNLYYSQSDPAAVEVSNLQVEDRPVPPVAIVGAVTPLTTGDAGLLFGDYFESYIDIDSADVGFTTLPANWWTGVEFYVTGLDPSRVVIYSWGGAEASGYNVGSIEMSYDLVTARVGNYIAQARLRAQPYQGQRLTAVVVVEDLIPTLYVYDSKDISRVVTGVGSSVSSMTIESYTGATVTMIDVVNDLTAAGLTMDGTGTAAYFSYGGNALAPNASLGVDIKIQVDLPVNNGLTATLAGDREVNGWRLYRMASPDRIAMEVKTPGGVTVAASTPGPDLSGKWWYWVRRDNTTGATTFARAPWGDDPEMVPVDWVTLGVGAGLTGAAITVAGTLPIGGLNAAPGHIYFPGTAGNSLTTPDSAALDILGDICIVARIQPSAWTSTAKQTIVSKLNTAGNQRSWAFSIDLNGTLELLWSADGTTAGPQPNSLGGLAGFSTTTPLYVAAVLDVDNGAGAYQTAFYTSSDGTSWSALGGPLAPVAGVTSLFNSSAALNIGGINNGAFQLFGGNISYVSVRSGCGPGATVGGTEVFRIDSSSIAAAGASTITANTGQTVTINRSGSPGTTVVPTPTTPQGTVRRLILGKYPSAPPSFDVYFKRFAEGDEISRVRYGSAGISSGYRLVKMAMGLGTVVPEQFSLVPETYTYNTPGVGLEQPNIFLRFHPSYYGRLTDNGLSWGFMGAILEPWDGMIWAPIGQYAFTRGTIDFDEVRARFLKLEISNLVIEPYDSFTVKARAVKRVVDKPVQPTGRSVTAGSQSVVNTIAAPRYPDAIDVGPSPVNNGQSPTAALVVKDSAQRATIGANAGYGFALASWQVAATMPLKQEVGLHYYQNVIVEPKARTAYFCGFQEIRARRRNLRDMGDTPVYFDTLLTADNIDTSQLTMNLEPGQAFTNEAPTNSVLPSPQVIQSLPFYSWTAVDALQIATQQTGPVQIIPDDEFTSPDLPGASFASQSAWHYSGDAAIIWDAKVGGPRVTRDPEPLSAIAIQDTPIVHPPVSPVTDSITDEGSRNVGYGESGGISSPFVAVSPYGTLYLGARVFCDKEIGDDLFLRLYGADGTTVLAEQQFRPATNVSTEVFLNYSLGSNATLESSVQVRLEQNGPNVSSWVMQALSAFDSSVIFEVSNDGGLTWMPCNDVRNLHYGVVDFPTAGSALVWRMTAFRYNYVLDAVKIRPWYFHKLGSAV
jgi:hypothetical protein